MRLTIDSAELKVREGVSVLTAAQENNIYIPHLCSHPELQPYGGCRLCIVEVEGTPGYPAACTTTVADGMIVRTNTTSVQELRREVFELMLSEHPASCLLCEEADECVAYQGTVRKVGVTTGCRYCPKDGICELQRVAKSLGVRELSLPISYRGLPVERHEEFYDRDYNLCVYCARCVRMCQEHRKAAVLSFRQRGRLTTIGPAFSMTHQDAGCEFCGACVSVCPTGALAEKARKWCGPPERFAASVCPLCSLQCDIQAVVVGNRIVGTLPPGDPCDAGGDLCVKGRFCLGELTNHPDRLLVPRLHSPDGWEELEWSDAIAVAAEKLTGVPADRIALYVSPDLLLEDLVSVRGLAEDALHTENITSSAFSSALGGLLSVTLASPPPQTLTTSRCIVSFFFDGNYGYAPITLAIKRAVEEGARYFQIGWIADPTSRFATRRLIPPPGKEASLLRGLLDAVIENGADSAELRDLAGALRSTEGATFVLGMGIMHLAQGPEILNSIETIAKLTEASMMAPNPYGNFGGMVRTMKLKPHEEVNELIMGGKIDVLYLIGECPFTERPPAKFVIYQNALPPPPNLAPDLILPAASWGEVSGSLADSDGRVKTVAAAVPARGAALPDWQIVSKLVEAIGAGWVMPSSAEELAASLRNMSWIGATQVSGLGAKGAPDAGAFGGTSTMALPHVLLREISPHRFRGVSLATYVRGMARIAPEDTLLVNPGSARELDISNGASVLVEADHQTKVYPVALDKNVPPELFYVRASFDGIRGGLGLGAVRVSDARSTSPASNEAAKGQEPESSRGGCADV